MSRLAVHAANIQDRDGVAPPGGRPPHAPLLLRRRLSRAEGRKGRSQDGILDHEIVGRSSAAVGFEVLPKRWIVERTVAWLSRFRRLARDFERYARTVAAFIRSPSS